MTRMESEPEASTSREERRATSGASAPSSRGARRRPIRSRSFKGYLTLAAIGVFIPILLAGALGFYLLTKSSTSFQEQALETQVEVSQAGELLRDLDAFDRAAEDALERGYAPGMELRRLYAEVLDATGAIRSFDDEAERSAALQAQAQVRSAWATLNGIEAGDGVRTESQEAYERSISGAEALVLELVRLGVSELSLDLDATQVEERRDRIPLYAGLAIGLLIAFAAIRWLSRQVGSPLRRLREAAEALSAGTLTHRVKPDGPSESRSVAVAFNQMADSLEQGRRSLEARALTDPLTGLANRQRLEEKFDSVMAGPFEELAPTLLFVDLDRFKQINDSRGHAFGDEVLRHVGARLEGALRDEITVGRVGGDELALLIDWGHDASPGTDAAAIAERVLRIVSAPYAVAGQEVVLSCSIGIAHASDGYAFDDLLRDADLAMYAGRYRQAGGYSFFQPSMHAESVDRLDRIGALRRAVDAEEFTIHYQPLVHLRDDRGPAGVEALIRWPGPDGSLISPAEFIPLAEQTGLIVPLGCWVLHQACRQAVAWDEDGGPAAGLIVGVNLSARQLHDPELIDDVKAALRDSGLPPERLTLEITETAIMRDVEIAITTLHELRRLGVWLAIDDFGTGQSSLSYLRRFPVSHLKVAREFVEQVEATPNDMALVKGIVDLAHGLGHRVIAEGIERRGQGEILEALGCDIAQGFFYSRPVPAGDLVTALDRLEMPGCSTPSSSGSRALPVELSRAPLWKEGSEALLALRHSQIIRHLPDVTVILFDRDLRYLAIEGPALERAGWRREELEGKTLDEALPPESASALGLILSAVLAGHERHFDFGSSRNDLIFRIVAEPVRDDVGAIVGAIVVARDVTEQRLSEGASHAEPAMPAAT